MTKVVRWDKKEKPMLCHLNMIMSIGKKKKNTFDKIQDPFGMK